MIVITTLKKLINHAAMLKDNNFITCRNDY